MKPYLRRLTYSSINKKNVIKLILFTTKFKKIILSLKIYGNKLKTKTKSVVLNVINTNIIPNVKKTSAILFTTLLLKLLYLLKYE